jgi:hypothetical protein
MAKKPVTSSRPVKPVNPVKPVKSTKAAAASTPHLVSVVAGKRNITIDVRFMVDFLVQLLKTPSPTGYTEDALRLVRETGQLGSTALQHQGQLDRHVAGRQHAEPRVDRARDKRRHGQRDGHHHRSAAAQQDRRIDVEQRGRRGVLDHYQ